MRSYSEKYIKNYYPVKQGRSKGELLRGGGGFFVLSVFSHLYSKSLREQEINFSFEVEFLRIFSQDFSLYFHLEMLSTQGWIQDSLWRELKIVPILWKLNSEKKGITLNEKRGFGINFVLCCEKLFFFQKNSFKNLILIVAYTQSFENDSNKFFVIFSNFGAVKFIFLKCSENYKLRVKISD